MSLVNDISNDHFQTDTVTVIFNISEGGKIFPRFNFTVLGFKETLQSLSSFITQFIVSCDVIERRDVPVDVLSTITTSTSEMMTGNERVPIPVQDFR